ncbi:MAG: hypothetical protein IT305_18660 [Chloroflexi bacterium]|nr:hypothetical protein [Chloroflexota bacterium]
MSDSLRGDTPEQSPQHAADLGTAFEALVRRSVAAERAVLDEDVATIPARLAELSRRFVALDRRLPAAARRRAELDAAEDAKTFAARELACLKRLGGVRAVAVEGDRLTVVSEPIHLPWNGAVYRLGAYQLLLDLAGDVRIQSVDRLGPRPAWDHPHVQDGLPCLGNLREGVLKLIAEYELALATQLLLDFLHLYQPEDAYTPIEGWPIAGGASFSNTASQADGVTRDEVSPRVDRIETTDGDGSRLRWEGQR